MNLAHLCIVLSFGPSIAKSLDVEVIIFKQLLHVELVDNVQTQRWNVSTSHSGELKIERETKKSRLENYEHHTLLFDSHVIFTTEMDLSLDFHFE